MESFFYGMKVLSCGIEEYDIVRIIVGNLGGTVGIKLSTNTVPCAFCYLEFATRSMKKVFPTLCY